MQAYLYVLSFLFGLAVGSFLNVVIYRLPRQESLARPGSHCPGCGTPIHWYDNVPLLSWLVLRGRCRGCKARISWRYPVVEAMTGSAFVISMWRFDLSWPLLVAWAFAAAMIVIAFIDYDHMIIPNRIVLPGAVIGLAASIAIDPSRWWVYMVASVGAATFMFALVMLWPGGMGPGDVKMALFMGAVLGVSVIVGLFAAFLFGSLAGVFMMAVMKRARNIMFPFVPYLAVGSMVALFLGEQITSAYMSLFE